METNNPKPLTPMQRLAEETINYVDPKSPREMAIVNTIIRALKADKQSHIEAYYDGWGSGQKDEAYRRSETSEEPPTGEQWFQSKYPTP